MNHKSVKIVTLPKQCPRCRGAIKVALQAEKVAPGLMTVTCPCCSAVLMLQDGEQPVLRTME